MNSLSLSEIKISSVSEKEMPVIESLAKSFDLDMEKISHKQFIAAKKNKKIIGFGRLRKYSVCTEVATVGVIAEERKKGVGTAIVNELIRIGPKELFVTCVIPDFFSKTGFHIVKKFPAVLQKKVDFCKLYDFKENEIFVMKITK